MSVERDNRAWRTLRQKIIQAAARTNSPCSICGLPINYSASTNAAKNADNAPSVDHIRPWRDHPQLRLDPANLRITHQACNRAKGATTGPPSITNQSRQWGKPTP